MEAAGYSETPANITTLLDVTSQNSIHHGDRREHFVHPVTSPLSGLLLFEKSYVVNTPLTDRHLPSREIRQNRVLPLLPRSGSHVKENIRGKRSHEREGRSAEVTIKAPA
jgi:hypothetical protein